MSHLKRFFYHGCAYTVLISIVFYLFAIVLQLTDATVSIGRFFTILLFGFIIALAEFIFLADSLHTAVKYGVHYLVLFATFFIIFLTIRTEDGTSFSTSFIFSALAIFTVAYVLIFGAVKLAMHFINKNAKIQDKKQKQPHSAKAKNGRK